MNARAELPLHAPGTQVDKGYIGQSVPRPNAQRLLQGRGAFTDDLRFPRLAHVVFFRSPYAHAKVKKLDFAKALKSPGVIGVFDGRAVAEYCKPWVAVLAHLKGIKSAPQFAIAIERACWQGEAVAAVVAESRVQAEDAVQLIEAEWEELPVVTDMDEALAGKYVIHPELGDNICFKREIDPGGVDEAFAKADVVVEETYHFGRHTGVCLEGRAILADYNAAEHTLTVYHATQAPHMMQDIFSRHLNIPEANVRVIAKDVGGSYGIKVHVYPDEMATAAISVILRRPVKFVADRLESFLSDIHAREHRVTVRLAATKTGVIGVIGTAGTIRSGAYEQALRAAIPAARVRSLSCPLLVSLAEEGWVENPVARAVAAEYLAPFREEPVDALILGCTHYPVMKTVIREVLGGGTVLIDSGEEAARVVDILLSEGGMKSGGGEGGASFLVTDDPERFARVGEQFFGGRMGTVGKAVL